MTWNLHATDCLGPDGMATLADGSVDHVICDPPYSEHVHAKSRRGHTGYEETQSSRRATFNRSVDLGFEHITTDVMETAADQFARVAKRWILVFCDVESSQLWAGALRSTGNLEYVRTLAWVKVGATPQFTGDRPGIGFEAVVVAHRPGRKRWNAGGKLGVYEFPIVQNRGNGEDRVHTTQKPVALMEALVRDFTDPGETILDPFAGSGTTAVACVRLGRNFIGYERDPKYAEIARRRLEGTREQTDLFEPRKKAGKTGDLFPKQTS